MLKTLQPMKQATPPTPVLDPERFERCPGSPSRARGRPPCTWPPGGFFIPRMRARLMSERQPSAPFWLLHNDHLHPSEVMLAVDDRKAELGTRDIELSRRQAILQSPLLEASIRVQRHQEELQHRQAYGDARHSDKGFLHCLDHMDHDGDWLPPDSEHLLGLRLSAGHRE